MPMKEIADSKLETVEKTTLSTQLRSGLHLAYRAPSCSAHMFEQLIKAIGDLACSDTHFLLLGDLNLPDVLWRRGGSPKASGLRALRFIELCRSLNLHQLVFEGTHGSNILDLLLVNNLEFVVNTQVLAPIGSSDHSSIQFELNIGVDLKINQLPQHLIRCNRKKNLAWNKAIASGDSNYWDEYKRISSIFERKLNKFRSQIEKNVISSKNKNAFYRFLNSRLKKSKGVGVLFAEDGRAVRRDRDKAELLAYTFDKVYQKEVDLPDVETSPSFPVMSDSHWFQREEIYKLLA
ncbi:hypothetical protein OSTOST_16127, partial [Ostertagia ostertagi]